MSKSFWAVATGLVLTAGGATACDPAYKTIVCYETVTCYVPKVVCYTEHVTQKDECGRPVTVCVTRSKTVQVPVTKVVKVTKRVPVCD